MYFRKEGRWESNHRQVHERQGSVMWGMKWKSGGTGRLKRFRVAGLTVIVATSWGVGCAPAWGRGGLNDAAVTALPNSPGFQAGAAQQLAGTAVVSGVVLDIRGAAVPGAKVTVSATAGGGEHVVETGSDGRFEFTGLKAERVTVTITAAGLETFVSNEIHLTPGEKYELPKIALPVAPENTSVNVTVTEDELATAEVKQQEKQRVLGVIPNFYTSYLWDAAPMRKKQKFHLMVKSALDPEVFVVTGLRAGVQQYRGSYPGYGDGFEGFAARYGAAYGDSVTGRIVGRALLPIVFHQDPRYFFLGSGGVLKRTWYALYEAVVCRGDNGKTQPNYSHVLGNFASAGLRNVYLPPESRKGSEVLLNGFTLTGLNALTNLMREFLPKGATTNVPDYKRGKPTRD